MTVALTQTADQEKALLKEWFETVKFDEESEGIPPLDPEEDDEESRSFAFKLAEQNIVSTLDMDTLMAELRKRDPDNPF